MGALVITRALPSRESKICEHNSYSNDFQMFPTYFMRLFLATIGLHRLRQKIREKINIGKINHYLLIPIFAIKYLGVNKPFFPLVSRLKKYFLIQRKNLGIIASPFSKNYFHPKIIPEKLLR